MFCEDVLITILKKLDIGTSLKFMVCNKVLIKEKNINYILTNFFQREFKNIENIIEMFNEQFQVKSKIEVQTISMNSYHKLLKERDYKYSPEIDDIDSINNSENFFIYEKFLAIKKGIDIIIKRNNELEEYIKTIIGVKKHFNNIPEHLREYFTIKGDVTGFQDIIYSQLHLIYDNKIIQLLKDNVMVNGVNNIANNNNLANTGLFNTVFINNNKLLSNISEEFINNNNFYKCNISKFYSIVEVTGDILGYSDTYAKTQFV